MAWFSSVVLLALAPAAPVAPVAYRCLDDSKFTLTATPTLAVKYESKKATLYLDGDFAAFIAEDRPLPGCYRAKGSAGG